MKSLPLKLLSAFLALTLLCGLSFAFSSCSDSDEPSSEIASSSEAEASSAEPSSEEPSSEPSSEPQKPDYSLEKIDTVKKLEKTGDEPAVTWEEKVFDFTAGSAGYERLYISGGPVYGDGGVTLNGGTIQYSPKQQIDSERVEITFGFTVTDLPKTLERDTTFVNADDILTFAIADTGHWYDSNTDYGVKFRITALPSGMIRFYGFSKSQSNQDLARDGSKYDFEAGAYYKVVLIAENDRVSFTVNDTIVSNCYAPLDIIKNFRLAVRKGVGICIDSVSVRGTDSPSFAVPQTLSDFIGAGCFTGYVDAKTAEEGIYLNRLSHEQLLYNDFLLLAGASSGVQLDFMSDTHRLELTYKVMDSIWANGWDAGFDVYLNGEKQRTRYQTVIKNGVYTFKFNLPDEATGTNRITVYFPPSVTVTLLNLRINEGASFTKAEHSRKLLVLGDSITEGHAVDSSSMLYSLEVAREFDFEVLNQAVSGTIFSDRSVYGDYGDFKPDCVIIAYGTNNYGDGSASFSYVKQIIREGMLDVVGGIRERWGDEIQIFGLLPIARTNEEGANFTLAQTSEYIDSVYKELGVTVIDCHPFLPLEQQYFHDTMLHPNAKGNELYAEKLKEALRPYLTEANQ